jgi:hypothetical protein
MGCIMLRLSAFFVSLPEMLASSLRRHVTTSHPTYLRARQC